MFAAGIAMVRRSRISGRDDNPNQGSSPDDNPTKSFAGDEQAAGRRRTLVLLAAGFGIGTITGFLGVTGGFLIVPVLVMAGGLDIHRAAATSLAVSAVNCAAGLLGHLHAQRIELESSLPFLGMTIAGMLVGMATAHRVPARRLEQGFAALVLAVALATAAANLSALARSAPSGPIPQETR
jgi:uncharacterized membrane protein YfcA